MPSTDVLEPTARRIPLDGPVNFRDLGGYRSSDGRTVRWRQVFRADGLDTMSPRDVDVVVGELDVRTVIDLRTEREVDLTGVGPIADVDDVSWWNVSIIDETQPTWRDALEQGTIVDQYVVMLEGSSDKFVHALTLLAESDGATVFHCAAGKDRTGLLAALLLSLLGVSERQIAHDYALTAEVLPHLQARWEARVEDPRWRDQIAARSNWREVTRRVLTADEATLVQVFAGLRDGWGSPESWLVEHGLDAGVADALRRSLLV